MLGTPPNLATEPARGCWVRIFCLDNYDDVNLLGFFCLAVELGISVPKPWWSTFARYRYVFWWTIDERGVFFLKYVCTLLVFRCTMHLFFKDIWRYNGRNFRYSLFCSVSSGCYDPSIPSNYPRSIEIMFFIILHSVLWRAPISALIGQSHPTVCLKFTTLVNESVTHSSPLTQIEYDMCKQNRCIDTDETDENMYKVV